MAISSLFIQNLFPFPLSQPPTDHTSNSHFKFCTGVVNWSMSSLSTGWSVTVDMNIDGQSTWTVRKYGWYWLTVNPFKVDIDIDCWSTYGKIRLISISTVDLPAVNINIDRGSTYGKIWSIVDCLESIEMIFFQSLTSVYCDLLQALNTQQQRQQWTHSQECLKDSQQFAQNKTVQWLALVTTSVATISNDFVWRLRIRLAFGFLLTALSLCDTLTLSFGCGWAFPRFPGYEKFSARISYGPKGGEKWFRTHIQPEVMVLWVVKNNPNKHPIMDTNPLIYWPVNLSRLSLTSTVDPPTGKYGWYQPRPLIHLRSILTSTVDPPTGKHVRLWIVNKYRDSFVVDFINNTCEYCQWWNNGFGRGGLFVPQDDPAPKIRSFLGHFWGVVLNFAFNKVVPPWIWAKLFRHYDTKVGGPEKVHQHDEVVESSKTGCRCHGTLQGRGRLRVTDSKRLLLYWGTVLLRSHEIIVSI